MLDVTKIYFVTGTYSLGLGISGVSLTFLAIAKELDLSQIALLSAVSAISQMSARIPLGYALRFVTDRTVMLVAFATLGAAMAATITVPGIAGLALAQLLQGTSRAGFWSASQTHVIRVAKHATRGLARSQFIASLSSIAGPVLAGTLWQVGSSWGGWLVLGLSLVGGIGALALTRLPLFDPPRQPERGRVWRRSGVVISSLGSLAGGVWYAVITTFVPVVFASEGWGEISIGIVIAMTNGMLLLGVIMSGRTPASRFVPAVTLGSVVGALGVCCLSLVAWAPVITVAALVVSGSGTGVLMTLGPALAAESVHPEERGQAVVVTGTYRAAALLGAPLLVSAATLVVPVGVALMLLGGLACAPAVVASIMRTHARLS